MKIIDGQAVKYALKCIQPDNDKAPKYVKKQCAAWLEIVQGSDDEAYVDEQVYGVLCSLLKLIIHPDFDKPMYERMEPYAWLLITAVFCTRARSDGSWYYRTALLEICRKNFKTFYAGLIFILGMLIMGKFGRYFSVAPDLKLSKELQIAIRKIIKSSPALNDGTIPKCKAIFKDYSVSVDGNIYPKSDFLKILRNSKGNGRGAGIVSESGTMLATAYNTMLYENSVVKKGGNKKGFFTSQNQQTKEAMKSIKDAWREMNSSSQRMEDNVCVLNAGMDFKEVSNTSMDMQLNQNKKTNSGEICGIFGISSNMMSGNASAETKENFITDTLTPLLNIFETAFDSDLLMETEKGKRYFAFDTRELTRGDILKRYQAYAIGKEKGFIQIDDIRKQEDMPPLNIPFINLGLGDVLYNPETGEIYTPNTDKVINIRELGWSLGKKDNDDSEENLDNSEELRYNPYHDPTNGRFTTSSGGMGAVLHVPMGAKGKGEYVISANFEDPENRKNMTAKERGVKNYKENQTFHIAKPNGTFEEMNGDTFEFSGREFGIHNIYGFTAGNFAVTDTKTGLSVGWYHTPKEAVSGIRKKINAIKSFKNLDAAESALDAYLDVKASKRAGELRFNPNHDPKNGKFTSSSGGISSKDLTTVGKNVKLDSKGNPYSYPQLTLPKKEYGKVMHEINTLYDTKYKGLEKSVHKSGNYAYRFEIHDFDEYNIFHKYKI